MSFGEDGESGEYAFPSHMEVTSSIDAVNKTLRNIRLLQRPNDVDTSFGKKIGAFE